MAGQLIFLKCLYKSNAKIKSSYNYRIEYKIIDI